MMDLAMKKITINKTFICFLLSLEIASMATGQVGLQCPPCLPVNGCDRCWTSIQEAQDNGCSAAGRSSDQVNELQSATKEDKRKTQLLTSNSIYPNPSFDGYFTLENANGFTGIIEVINASGKILLSYELNKQTLFKFNEQLTPGLYILVLKESNGIHATKKLVVR